MFAILGLIGVALSAAVFVDFGGEEDADTDNMGDATEPDPEIVSVSDLLSDTGEAMPGAEALDAVEGDLSLNQIIYTGDEGASIAAEDGDDYVHGGDGADELYGGSGNDELHGGRNDDFIIGDEGDDTLYGHVGDDVLDGGDGNDTLVGGDGDDRLDGGDGDDVLTGYLGDDTLIGGDGADMLNGGGGNDLLIGTDDDDTDFLNGGSGDDRIEAGVGDHLNGGTGADTFAVLNNGGAFIDDFDPAEDVIELGYDTVPPVLTTANGDDGLTLFADGEAVATLGGVTTLDLSTVRLIPLEAA